LTPLGDRAGEQVEGQETSISRSSNIDGEEGGGVASIADGGGGEERVPGLAAECDVCSNMEQA
jgi:hypothetical protein